jgi:mRNA interferase RelE/StbE
MKHYKLTYRRSVSKDLRSIRVEVRRVIIERIESLASNPRPAGAVKLQGSQDLYRFRYADYRVIYQINEQIVTVLIIKVGHRKNVYKHR